MRPIHQVQINTVHGRSVYHIYYRDYRKCVLSSGLLILFVAERDYAPSSLRSNELVSSLTRPDVAMTLYFSQEALNDAHASSVIKDSCRGLEVSTWWSGGLFQER